jgi:hypothetical protein
MATEQEYQIFQANSRYIKKTTKNQKTLLIKIFLFLKNPTSYTKNSIFARFFGPNFLHDKKILKLKSQIFLLRASLTRNKENLTTLIYEYTVLNLLII